MSRTVDITTFEIFFEDLNDEAQRQLLETFDIENAERFNNMPIAVAYCTKEPA